MKAYIRRIVAYCMQIWIEDRAQRRAEEDAFHIQLFRDVFSESDTLEEWNMLPRRLQCKILHLLPQWLDDAARKGDKQLLIMLKNAEMCDMYGNEEGKKRLYAKALANAKGIAKIPFAKLLHGTVLPIELVEHIAEQFTEAPLWDRLVGNLATNHYAVKLLKEIHTEELRQRYLEFLAVHGKYVLLRDTCALLNIPIRYDLLNACLCMCLTKRSHPKYIAEQCITLCTMSGNWDIANEVIAKLAPQSPEYAGNIALAMWLHTSKSNEECIPL